MNNKVFQWIMLLVFLSIAFNHCNERHSDKKKFTIEESSWLKRHKVIRLAPYPDYRPAEFIDENGNYKGIAADYLKIIQEKTGIQISFIHIKSWSKTLEALKDKKIDLIALASQTSERNEYAHFSQPYLDFPMVILTSKHISSTLTPHSLANKKVAVVDGYAAQKYLSKNYPRISINPVKNEIAGLRKVSFGEVLAFVTDLSSASYFINKEGITNLRVNHNLDYRYKLAYAIRKDWPLLKSILDKSLNSIPEKEKKKIFNKWVSLRLESPLLTTSFILSSISISLIIVFLAIFFILRNKALRYKLRVEILQKEALQSNALRAEVENKSKTRFLAHMSHEIRTPLNSIIGFANIMNETELSANNQQNIKNIKISSKLLLSLVNDILDISKIEVDQFHLNEQNNDMHQLLDEVSDIAKILIKESGKEIKLIKNYTARKNIMAVLDEMRFRQIFVNLINNAVKFTNEGEIEIIFNIHPDKTMNFKIRDSGIGISKIDQEKLFKEFSQIRSPNNQTYQGTGLGLVITKKLVQLMSGEIWLISKTGNKSGTTVSFTLPHKSGQDSKEKPSDSISFKTGILENKKILVVEDIQLNRLLLQKILQKQGCHILESENGELALQCLIDNPDIDLILMDIQMPVLNGIEATKKIMQLKKENKIKNIPIIAVTANAMKTEKDEALRSGCDDYLTKPINPAELLSCMKKLLSN